MNIRHDVANYHRSTDEEKNIFWLKELKKPYSQVSFQNHVKMIHTSKLVEAYIASSDLEKSILWSIYDQQSQMYCDYARFCKKYELQKALWQIS